ncbi:hypothetical protein [Psychromonas sp. Urea-02u-13]|uniref:hypothetical protein n=1 Tax=Psychromonas sp. Urea-02u-13 TaxID=2058326 RepID=UPI000C3286C8|nr:hypothetical protein [Psychromonas sp. Urea-02u-13]PKG37572.1 hypothetical protein CXF74_18150 [Psychromonas sp. Urea-02u-13]
MLIFYIICGCFIFAASGVIMQYNRLAIYRRRIIRHFAKSSQQKPFILSESQEQHIKQCFLKGISIQHCIEQI